jgi:hypothetical protein
MHDQVGMPDVRNADDSLPDPRQQLWRERKRVTNLAALVLYVLMLSAISIHLYRKPVYSMDSIQYMGNALLMEDTDMDRVHQRVYDEVRRRVPEVERAGLLGHEMGAPEGQNKSRQERAASASRFAEFLPLFAIRPLYNQTLWLVSRSGLGLVRSGIVISVSSYFLLGIVVFLWVGRYASLPFAIAVSILLMLCPPIVDLGRETTADGLATLIAFTALFLIFEARRLAAGVTLLLASIYFRTDFVVLAGPTILACWLQRRVELWKAGVLGLLAIASLLCIDHLAGDYGIRMLYYRNFVGVPIAPGEMTVQFSFRDYVGAFRSGITLALNSFLLPFLTLGVIGAVSKRTRVVFGVALSYVFLHFLALPNWEERWFGVFYVSMGVCAATAIATTQRGAAISKTADGDAVTPTRR